MRSTLSTVAVTAERLVETPFGERRELTALSYDLKDSTALLVQSDLEDFERMVSAFQEQSGQAIRQHGGSIRQTLGDDGGVAFFGFPTAMEDSATAAIRAGLAIVDACSRLTLAGSPVHVRIGIATSEVVVTQTSGTAGPTIVGFAPLLAARLQALSTPGRVLVVERTRALAGRSFAFRYLGPRPLKGLAEQQTIWEVGPRASRTTRFFALGRLGTRMVGRDPELVRALATWRGAAAGHGRVLVVEGEAGIGKSRFMLEVLKATRRERARLVLLQCAANGVDAALHPIVDLLQSEAAERRGPQQLTANGIAAALGREGIGDAEVADAIAFAVGAMGREQAGGDEPDVARQRERVVAALMRCIDRWVATGPLVVAVEDVHWIDPTSRDILGAVAAAVADRPVLLLLTTRADKSWKELGGRVDQIRLKRLRAPQAAMLAVDLWARRNRSALPPEAVAPLLRRTSGIPLFVEEMLQGLAANADHASDWISSLAKTRLSSFESLLSARLGTLGPAKRIAQAAAVIGREFDEPMLHAIVPVAPGAALDGLLADLVRAGILSPRKADQGSRWSFRHGLIQETLFNSLVRADRATLHRRILDAHATEAEGRASLAAAVLGAHAEGAGLHGEASAYYVAAARDSVTRSATAEARNLLHRAAAMGRLVKDEHERDRAELAVSAALGPILTSTEGTKSAEACALYERAVAIARRRPIEEQAALFPIYWGWWYTGADFAIQRQRAETVTATLAEVDDPEVQLQARHCLWANDFNTGHHRGCIEAVRAGLALYQAGKGRESLTLYGGHDARVCGLGQTGLSLWFQGMPSRAVAAVEEALGWAAEIGQVGSLAHAYDIAAMLHCYREDLRALRDTTTAMRRLARRHDLPPLAAKALIFEGWRLAKLGDPLRGRASADAGFAIQWDIGTREDFPVYSGMRAEILALCAEPQAALTLIDDALEEAARTGHAYWTPELHRRRAILLAEVGAAEAEIAAPLATAMRIARGQGAATLLLRACETALRLGTWSAMRDELAGAVAEALDGVEQGGEMEPLVSAVRLGLGGPAGAEHTS